MSALIPPTRAIINFAWKCSFCGKEVIETQIVSAGCPSYIPSMPDGWMEIRAPYVEHVCEDHAVTVMVDGKPVTLLPVTQKRV